MNIAIGVESLILISRCDPVIHDDLMEDSRYMSRRSFNVDGCGCLEPVTVLTILATNYAGRVLQIYQREQRGGEWDGSLLFRLPRRSHEVRSRVFWICLGR